MGQVVFLEGLVIAEVEFQDIAVLMVLMVHLDFLVFQATAVQELAVLVVLADILEQFQVKMLKHGFSFMVAQDHQLLMVLTI